MMLGMHQPRAKHRELEDAIRIKSATDGRHQQVGGTGIDHQGGILKVAIVRFRATRQRQRGRTPPPQVTGIADVQACQTTTGAKGRRHLRGDAPDALVGRKASRHRHDRGAIERRRSEGMYGGRQEGGQIHFMEGIRASIG